MDSRPVIIIGGGLWGSLLAFRLKQCLPDVPFKIYEPTQELGEGVSWTFHQNDLGPQVLRWIRPFFTQSWPSHKVEFSKFSNDISDSFCLIHSTQFEKILRRELPPSSIVKNFEIEIEDALNEGSFVIDTRNFGHHKTSRFLKSLGFLYKLKSPHNLRAPITMDAKVSQKEGFRFLQFLPMSELEVLVRDVRYSSHPAFHTGLMKQEMTEELINRGWEVEAIFDQEFSLRGVPDDQVEVRNDGRVINLSGIFHDITGDSLPDAVRLIDRMVKTSFRLGELKEVVREYRAEREKKRKYFRFICKHNKNSQMYQRLYQMPPQLRAKFYSGDLEFLDICRALIESPVLKLPKVLTLLGE